MSTPGAPAPATDPAASPTRASLSRRSLRFLLKWGLLALLLLALLAGLRLFVLLNYSYSKGERAGHLQKLSSRGWVCKTWEGELLQTTLPGVVPEKFTFSVRDEAVVRALQSQVGRRVALAYEQHQGLPSCFGETEYFVTAVRGLEP